MKKTRASVSLYEKNIPYSRLLAEFMKLAVLAQIVKTAKKQLFFICGAKERTIINNKKEQRIKRIRNGTLKNPSVW